MGANDLLLAGRDARVEANAPAVLTLDPARAARAPSGILELALTPERVAKNEPFLVSVMAEAEGSAPREIGSLAFFPPPRPGDTRQFLIDISELPDTGRAKLVIRLVPAGREPLTQTRLRVNGINFPERAH